MPEIPLRIPRPTSATKRLKYRSSRLQWVDEPVFWVDDYGAAGDGTTDDSTAIQSAYDAAAAITGTNFTYRKAVVAFTAGKSYRVTASIVAKRSVHTDGNGARLVGPITNYGRITGATSVPTATDIDGQTGGACFTDNEGTGASAALYWPSFGDLIIDGFRYGFVSKCLSWVHPVLERIEFRNTDIGVFCYQGSQQWTLRDINAGNDTNCLFAAAATCFASGHTLASRDNFFCDGLRIDCRRQTLNLSYDGDVDTWFESAILRPATSSVVSSGSFTFSPTGTYRKVTGRAVYAPSRNDRNLYGWRVGPLNLYDNPRGAVLLRKPIGCTFEDIAGESMFDNATVNTGADESMIVVGVGTVVSTASFRNIDADNSAGGSNYKGAIDITAEGATFNTHFDGHNITGACPERFFRSLTRQSVSGGSIASQRTSLRTPEARSVGLSTTSHQDLTTSFLPLAQGHNRSLIDNYDHELREQLISLRLPAAGGAQTRFDLNISGTPAADGIAQIIKGTLDVFMERLDTGETDYALYTCNLFQRFATSTTLGADVSAGATQITVASSSDAANFSPGTPILINSSEKARVLSRSGAVLTLTTALAGSFTSGQSVASTSAITNKIALTNAWITVAVSSGMLRITNAIDPVPIQVWLRFTYPKMEG